MWGNSWTVEVRLGKLEATFFILMMETKWLTPWFYCTVEPNNRDLYLTFLCVYSKMFIMSCLIWAFDSLLHSGVELFWYRIWYGSNAAVGGRIFSHSRGRHLLPRSGCRFQWIRHLRYYHVCVLCVCVYTHFCYVLGTTSGINHVRTKSLHGDKTWLLCKPLCVCLSVYLKLKTFNFIKH